MDCWILSKLKFIESGNSILKYYIALGSNLGDRLDFLKAAVKEVANIGVLVKKSTIYESEPFGFKDQQNYLNAVCVLKCEDDVLMLLRYLKDIEKRLGRKETIRWGPRNIDLDIIDWEGKEIKTKELTLPHPEMHNRNFVLIPLAEIEPEYKLRNGQSIKQILNDCPAGFIEPYSEQW